MNPLILIGYIGFFVWLFPPFRQYKSNYFYFFFALAVIDPINLFYVNIFHASINLNLILGPSLVLVSLVTLFPDKKKFLIYSFIMSAAAIAAKYAVPDYTNFILVILISIIFVILLNRTLKYISETAVFNLFHLALIVYMGANVLKFILFSADVVGNLAFLYATNLVQMIFGLFFIIFREDSKVLHIRINTAGSAEEKQ